MDVVDVSGSLDLRVSQSAERLVCLRVLVCSEKPSWRFGDHVDGEKGNSRDKGGTELVSPGINSTELDAHDVCCETEEDAKGCPELPGHGKSPSDSRRSVLS